MVALTTRELVPRQLHDLSRRTYVRLGTMTAGLRLAPEFVMLGASRCGTTSLFRALSSHPQVLRPTVNKGVRYFDLNYTRSWRWYLGHFPLQRTAERRARQAGARAVTFEASGYYVFHPAVAERMSRDLPDARLVVMLRNPVERAYSAWKHESARGFESESFERALELEEERLRGEAERLCADPAYTSFAYRHQSHRSRGEYVDQLERFLQHYPLSQLHVVQSERFFAQPQDEYLRLTRFLGLDDHVPSRFEVANARPSSPMPESVRRELEAHYAPFNERLENLLGEPLAWG
ncbi:MAG: sulfotransferase domain-containing protein [Angustibacter sp.]